MTAPFYFPEADIVHYFCQREFQTFTKTIGVTMKEQNLGLKTDSQPVGYNLERRVMANTKTVYSMPNPHNPRVYNHPIG